MTRELFIECMLVYVEWGFWITVYATVFFVIITLLSMLHDLYLAKRPRKMARKYVKGYN